MKPGILISLVILSLLILIYLSVSVENFRPEAQMEAKKIIQNRDRFVSGQSTYKDFKLMTNVADVDTYYRTRAELMKCRDDNDCYSGLVQILN